MSAKMKINECEAERVDSSGVIRGCLFAAPFSICFWISLCCLLAWICKLF